MLAFGFLVQAIAYAISFGSASIDPARDRAVGSIVGGVLTVGLLWTLWRTFRGRLVRRQLIEVARVDADTGKRHDRPALSHLVAYGRHLTTMGDDEPTEFVARVFGVTDVRHDD